MATYYWKDYRDKHKPEKRATVHRTNGRGSRLGTGVNICDNCHYLLKCRARIKDWRFDPYCFVTSKGHRYYVLRYGRQLEALA